jgi:hypothetical protein
MGLSPGEGASCGGDILLPGSGFGESGSGFGLPVESLSVPDLFVASARLKQSEFLTGRFRVVGSYVTFALIAIKINAGDFIGGQQLFNAAEIGFGIRGGSQVGGQSGLSLGNFLFAGPILGRFEACFCRGGRCYGLLNLFRAIAAQGTHERGLRLLYAGLRLSTLGLQVIRFKADHERAGFDILSFFDSDLRHSTTDF